MSETGLDIRDIDRDHQSVADRPPPVKYRQGRCGNLMGFRLHEREAEGSKLSIDCALRRNALAALMSRVPLRGSHDLALFINRLVRVHPSPSTRT